MRTLTFAIPGTPIPQARSRHRVVKLKSGATFVGQYDPAESRIWKATVAEFAARAMAGQRPIEGLVTVELVFMFLPAASWSKRKLAELRTAGEMARPVKPDLDNLIKGVVDGMKCDQHGNVYVTGPGGIWGISPRAVLLGGIRMTEIAANLSGGGPNWDELYCTCSTSGYRVQMKVRGSPAAYMSGVR